MKKFTIMMICLLVCISCCLSGCSTFSINKVKFYNEVVAEVYGKEITRFDLINSYNNYGYEYYVSQQGLSEKEALNKTLDLMVDRMLLAKYAKSNPVYALSDYDINNIYQEVLDYLDESFDTYTAQAREILGLEAIEDAEEDEEESETAYLEKDYKYSKRATLLYGDIIDYNEGSEAEEVITTWALDRDFVENYSSKTQKEIVTKLYTKFISNASSNKHNEESFDLIYKKAESLLSKYLISYEYYVRDEDGNKLSIDKISLIKRLIERVYTNEVENAYIKNIEDYYVRNSSLSIDKLLKRYESLAESDYAKYNSDLKAYYDYLKTIGTDAEMIYYSPADATAEFGYFFHILLPLDEAITTEIKEKKELNIYDDEALKTEIYNIIKNEKHQERNLETGLLYEEEKSIAEILNEYEAVTNIEQFKKFMFQYTSDTATLTADMPYVIGYETDENGKDTTYSGMVEEFTNEAVRLMKNNITQTAKNDYIVTQYGIHLLYYVGEVEAKFNYADRARMTISLDESAENNLYYAVANEHTGKTYFDILFDLVYPASDGSIYASENGYTDYEAGLVKSMKNENVVFYKTKIEGTSNLN